MARTLIGRSPLLDLAELRGWLGQAFDDVENDNGKTRAPAIDVVKEQGALIVGARIPGTSARTTPKAG